jgi:hypothetical protein
MAYQIRNLDIGTTFAQEKHGVWMMIDFNGDGLLDLVYIKTSQTSTGTVEIHVASAASNYQLVSSIQQPHLLLKITESANYTGGIHPDLIYIKTRNTAHRKVEVHIASAASKYQSRILQVGTTFGLEDNGVPVDDGGRYGKECG